MLDATVATKLVSNSPVKRHNVIIMYRAIWSSAYWLLCPAARRGLRACGQSNSDRTAISSFADAQSIRKVYFLVIYYWQPIETAEPGISDSL